MSAVPNLFPSLLPRLCARRRLSLSLGLGLTLLAALPVQAEPLRLKFSDFFVQPVGPAGLQPTPQLLQAQGQQVSLVGWMVAQEDPPAGYFLFTPRPVRMSEHADGDADDLPGHTVLVRLPATHAGVAPPHQPGLIELTGTLHYGRVVEPDGRVSWLQLQLPAR